MKLRNLFTTHKRRALILSLFLFPIIAAFSCEFSFWLSGPDNQSIRILPGSTLSLVAGEDYTLRVDFFEDHRNCKIPPEDTLFLIDDAKWRVNRDSQALILRNDIIWQENSRTQNSSTITFTAGVKGSTELTILRDCDKGGYDESITFMVK